MLRMGRMLRICSVFGPTLRVNVDSSERRSDPFNQLHPLHPYSLSSVGPAGCAVPRPGGTIRLSYVTQFPTVTILERGRPSVSLCHLTTLIWAGRKAGNRYPHSAGRPAAPSFLRTLLRRLARSAQRLI